MTKGADREPLRSAILGALSQAVPERVIAASNGANGVASFSGIGPDGNYYVYMETIGGGSGARSYKDGVDGVQVHMTNTSNLPIEVLEKEYPLLIERYEFIRDSGGAGRWRGGMGLRRVYRALGHATTFSGQGERSVHPPYGLFGGAPGRCGNICIVQDNGRRRQLSTKPAAIEVGDDAVVVVETPGAGGYGDPATRAVELVDEDLRGGKFSPGYVRAFYRRDKAGKPAKTETQS